MKLIAFAAAVALLLPAGSVADKPKITRAVIASVEKNFEGELMKLWPDDPVSIIGIPQGLYINGYGAVFTSQVNLAPAAGITPFHPTNTKEDVARTHHKKLERLPKLREAMQALLLSSAASLDTVPPEEQITVGVSLFYWYWEDTAGLPAQIVMHAPKRALVNKSTLASVVSVQEF
jgi:hypothetical protein